MLKLLIGTDWKENRKMLLQMLAQDVRQGLGGRILMVPELVSHQTERELALAAGDTASRCAEVLSFTRLAVRVAEYLGCQVLDCLDNGGRIVAMASATRQLRSRLKAYAAVETRPEFLTGLLEAVDEFKRCCITPADLMNASLQTQGNFAQKLEELSLILETYNTVCARGKRDPRDQMTWLLEMLTDSNFAQKHTFYFDSFPDFSRQHQDIVFHLLKCSPEVVITVNCDRPGSDAMAFEKAGETAKLLLSFAKAQDIPVQIISVDEGNSALGTYCTRLLQGAIPEGAVKQLRVCRAESVYAECAAATEQIVELVQSGCRYRDISIVCTDMQAYTGPIHTVLERAHIPVYLSGTEDILNKTVIVSVLSAIDAALNGFEQKDVLRYMRSMLSPLGAEQCDRLENYAILWSVDGKRWLQPWQYHPRGLGELWTDRDKEKLQSLNDAREKAIAPLGRLYERFRQAVGVQQQVQAVYSFLCDIQLSGRLQRLSEQMDQKGDNRSAQILNQLWDILLNALEQVHDVLADTTWDAETFTRLLKLLLSQYDVGTIPSVLDAVTVGSVSAMRCQRSKHLIVLGAAEGLFPSYGSNAGVLNDQERLLLQRLGVPVNPGAIDGLQTQFSEIQEVFCGAEQTATVYCSEGQPSFIFNRLAKLAGGETAVYPVFGAALTDRVEAAAYLVSVGAEEQAAALDLTEQYHCVADSKNHGLGAIEQDHVKMLYGTELLLSASQIDRLAECRLSYFLKYGLRAKERKPAKIDPAEFGTYVHAVLEECGRTVVKMGGFREVSLEKTLDIAAEVSAKYFAERFQDLSTERLSYHFSKNEQEVKLIVEELWKEMQESLFQAVDFELSFGDGMQMPAIDIPSNFFAAKLRGFVDRVDIWDDNGSTYMRVVDYKTGKKDFDYCDVFNGIGLQMLLYLYALEDGAQAHFGSKAVGAGVQYFPARVPLMPADGRLTDDEAAQARSKIFKRKGLLLNDEAVLQAMEPAEQPKRLCCTRKKDGTLSGDLATRQQFHQLKAYVYKLLEQIVDDIASGNVTPNPYTRGSSHNACSFCPYGVICNPAEVEGRRNYQAMSADRFWTEIERKEQKHG